VRTSAALNETGGPQDEVEELGFGRVVKRAWAIACGHEQLTSYGGVELWRHYCQLSGLNRRIRQGFRAHDRGGDYGCVHLVLLVVGLLVVGARRLKQLR
jgi:hypothetical protein